MSNKNYKDLIIFADDMDERTIREALLKGERVTLECKSVREAINKIFLKFTAQSLQLQNIFPIFATV